MLEKEGARTLRCPMVAIRDSPDAETVVAWLRDLVAGRFDLVVLMTGEGLRRLLGFADRAGLRNQAIQALGRTQIVTRGPKPGRALKEIGLTPTKVASEPTTEGVIETLRGLDIQGKRIGVQLYEEANPALVEFLRSAGAKVHTVMPYVYGPASDTGQVSDLIHKLAEGQVDAIVFTSTPQVDRLYEVAEQQGELALLQRGLELTRVAAVGPVVAENLRARGAPVAICPEQGFVMKNLVQQIKRALGGE